jgi:hypothetical protein
MLQRFRDLKDHLVLILSAIFSHQVEPLRIITHLNQQNGQSSDFIY